MSCTHVPAVATHATSAVRVRIECEQDACEVACVGDHMERRGGHGRVRRRAPTEVAVTVFCAVKKCVPERVKRIYEEFW